jgi:hypothetical protein
MVMNCEFGRIMEKISHSKITQIQLGSFVPQLIFKLNTFYV